jgi:hypothetical protein
MKILRTSGDSDTHAVDLPSHIDLSSSPAILNAPAALQQIQKLAEPVDVEARLLRPVSDNMRPSGNKGKVGN